MTVLKQIFSRLNSSIRNLRYKNLISPFITEKLTYSTQTLSYVHKQSVAVHKIHHLKYQSHQANGRQTG